MKLNLLGDAFVRAAEASMAFLIRLQVMKAPQIQGMTLARDHLGSWAEGP